MCTYTITTFSASHVAELAKETTTAVIGLALALASVEIPRHDISDDDRKLPR